MGSVVVRSGLHSAELNLKAIWASSFCQKITEATSGVLKTLAIYLRAPPHIFPLSCKFCCAQVDAPSRPPLPLLEHRHLVTCFLLPVLLLLLLWINAGFWKWNFVATQRNEDETHSSSTYTQSDIASPPNSLTDYVDGDSIRRKDLVVWVNSGLYHVPMAEDAPVTPASGHNQLGFSLM